MIDFGEVKDFITIRAVRFFLRVFYIFPVNSKKIYFSSYEGKQFSCNPKYIFLKLKDLKKSELNYVYEYNGRNLPVELQKEIKIVKHNSFQYIVEIMTSKVIITNSGLTPKIPLRKSQILINTWHGGGAYKKSGKDLDREKNGSGKYYIELSERQTSYFLTNSQQFTQIIHSALGIELTKMINSGSPRNDLFFSCDKKNHIHKAAIQSALNLKNNSKLVLYAPTYRGKVGNVEKDPYESLDILLLLNTLHNKFGGTWMLLYRGHYFNPVSIHNNGSIDVSTYPDMQQLLCVIDVLITDYSSSIWDFSFTDKPAFLFVPDLEAYINDRDFYVPIDQWPYNYARNNLELQDIIQQYDPILQKQKNKKHHEMFKSYETGKATEMVVDLVLQNI